MWAFLSNKVVIIIKCRYKFCRHNNEVKKEDAIKEGNSYYCKNCYAEKIAKQQIEKYYLENLPPTTLPILRKVINQLIHTNNYDADYVLFMVKKIHNNNFKINNPFGLINYCNNVKNLEEWQKKKINEEYKNIKDEIVSYDINNEIDFKYIPNNRKRWTDLI